MDATVSTRDLKARINSKESVTLVEAFAPDRYREAHIPGALNIPPERIKNSLRSCCPTKTLRSSPIARTIIDPPALTAAPELAAMGYTNVAHYPEAKQDWMSTGLPVDKGA